MKLKHKLSNGKRITLPNGVIYNKTVDAFYFRSHLYRAVKDGNYFYVKNFESDLHALQATINTMKYYISIGKYIPHIRKPKDHVAVNDYRVSVMLYEAKTKKFKAKHFNFNQEDKTEDELIAHAKDLRVKSVNKFIDHFVSNLPNLIKGDVVDKLGNVYVFDKPKCI